MVVSAATCSLVARARSMRFSWHRMTGTPEAGGVSQLPPCDVASTAARFHRRTSLEPSRRPALKLPDHVARVAFRPLPILLLALLVPGRAVAQSGEERVARLSVPTMAARGAGLSATDSTPGRWMAGLGFGLAIPQGEFANFVDDGYGVVGHVGYKLNERGWAAIRMDAGLVVYGHQTRRATLSPTVPEILVDVSTDNDIAMFSVGPELLVPDGAVRPYVDGSVGLGYFFTQSSVKGSSNSESFARTTNFDDATFAWGVGGGLLVPVHRGRTVISIDAGLHYRAHGQTRYLREGSIRPDGSGGVTITPIQSDTNLLLLNIGASIFF